MKISAKELNPNGYATTDKMSQNLEILLHRINVIREAYGKPMVVTSGLRSAEDMRRIYKDSAKIPWGSKHLLGAAVDIEDRTGELAAWALSNLSLLEKIGLWIEEPAKTPGWAHFQIEPPKSGKRVFSP